LVTANFTTKTSYLGTLSQFCDVIQDQISYIKS
jgi:hypothetical protein